MMNQERFDGLARSLATGRLTRWQVLKAFCAVASLGFLETLSPLRIPFAVAASCANNNCRPDPEPENNRCESCTKMVNYFGDTGVKDAVGNYHPASPGSPGYVGWTWYEWVVSYRPPAVKGPYKNTSGKWCYKGTYKYKASVKNEVRRIRWVPNPPVPKDCKTKCDKAIKAWCAQVDAHERHHVQDNQAIESKANAGTAKFVDLTPPPFEGCAITKADAPDAFNEMQQKAKMYQARLLQELGKESQKRGRAFDKSAKPIPTPCDSCEKCGCGSNGVPCSPDKPDCCKGQCVDRQTNSNNCGTCGKKCATGQTCNQGTCGDGDQGGGDTCGGVTCPPDRPVCCKKSNSAQYNTCISECSPGYRRNPSTCLCERDCSTNVDGWTQQCRDPSGQVHDFCCPPESTCCITSPYNYKCCRAGYTCCPSGACYNVC
jgi:hypothetical protein